jgi:hypothetical protein
MFGVVHVARGWLWHTRYRIRNFWTWKREGALCAAAGVVMIAATQATLFGLPAVPAVDLTATIVTAPAEESVARIDTPAPAAAIEAPPTISAAVDPVELVDDGITEGAAITEPLETASIGTGADPVEEGNGEDLIAQKLFDDQVDTKEIVPNVEGEEDAQ